MRWRSGRIEGNRLILSVRSDGRVFFEFLPLQIFRINHTMIAITTLSKGRIV